MENIEKLEKAQTLILKYRELSSTFIKLLDAISEIEKSPTPFVIKHNAGIITDCYKIITGYKDDENYDKIVGHTIDFIGKLRGDLIITKEHIKILDKKYIRNS